MADRERQLKNILHDIVALDPFVSDPELRLFLGLLRSTEPLGSARDGGLATGRTLLDLVGPCVEPLDLREMSGRGLTTICEGEDGDEDGGDESDDEDAQKLVETSDDLNNTAQLFIDFDKLRADNITLQIENAVIRDNMLAHNALCLA